MQALRPVLDDAGVGLAVPGRRVAGGDRGAGLRLTGALSAACFALLMAHALLVAPDAPDSLDLRLMIQIQRVDLPELGRWLNTFEVLTDSSGAVIAWLVTLGWCAALRWWLPALAVSALPLGGVINETISRVLVPRTRPHSDLLRHTSENFEDRSFPSGHVVGAVLLYGLIWYIAAQRIHVAPLRWLVQAGCAGVMFLTGFDRVWDGAHWPTDVAAGYALGLAMLVALILAVEWIERQAALVVAAARDGAMPGRFAPHGAMASSLAGVVVALFAHRRWLAAALVASQAGGGVPWPRRRVPRTRPEDGVREASVASLSGEDARDHRRAKHPGRG